MDISLDLDSYIEAERTPLNRSVEVEDKPFKSIIFSRLFILYKSIKSDLISYLNEYGISFGKNSKEVKEKLVQIIYEVNNNDVVIFAKKGCSYCERTKKLVTEKQKDIFFTHNTVIGTESNLKIALGVALNLMDVTFPQIIIRGTYIGGHDDFIKLVSSEKFNILIQSEHIEPRANTIQWYPPLLREISTPNLFISLNISSSTATTISWYFFQPYLYGNLIRYISVIHVVILGICLGLLADDSSDRAKILSYILLIYLIIDCGLIVIHGLSPFSPSGTLSTYYLWKYRGNITSSIPYKFVFGLYAATFVSLLIANDLTSTTAIASFTSTIINSAILVVFRF